MLAVAIHFYFAVDGRPSPGRNTGGSYISPGHCTTGLDVPDLYRLFASCLRQAWQSPH